MKEYVTIHSVSEKYKEVLQLISKDQVVSIKIISELLDMNFYAEEEVNILNET